MKISVDLSLYPLNEGYVEPIRAFIRSLENCEDLTIRKNRLSTQVFGEYDTVMNAIQQCMKTTFEQEGTFAMVAKILSSDRS